MACPLDMSRHFFTSRAQIGKCKIRRTNRSIEINNLYNHSRPNSGEAFELRDRNAAVAVAEHYYLILSHVKVEFGANK